MTVRRNVGLIGSVTLAEAGRAKRVGAFLPLSSLSRVSYLCFFWPNISRNKRERSVLIRVLWVQGRVESRPAGADPEHVSKAVCENCWYSSLLLERPQC